MRDADFKALPHVVDPFVVATRGAQVAPGYKPDLTVRSRQGTLKFIIESEQKTDRKAFLGDLVKAEVFAEKEQARPELIMVMQMAGNTTTSQIARHLRPYAEWLAATKGGKPNLAAIHVLSDVEYAESLRAMEPLGSPAFKRRGHLIGLRA